MSKNANLIAVAVALLTAGCPGTTNPPPDAGADAPVLADTPVLSDTPTPPDAPADTGGDPDDGGTDAPSDAGPPPLPAITNPAAHTEPSSADGHDRFLGVVFDSDSSFYVVGTTADSTAATADLRTLVGHFTAAGDLDTSWGDGGWFEHNIVVGTNGEVARGIDLQSDGSIVVAATIEHVETGVDARDRDVAVLRIDASTGELDPSFGTAGVATFDLTDGVANGTAWVADGAWNLEVDDTDRIVVAVQVVRAGGMDTDFGVLRVMADGSAADSTFSGDGLFSLDLDNVNASVREVHILPDGRIAGAGYYSLSSVVRPVLYEVDEDGELVTAFGGGDGVYTEIVLDRQIEAYGAALHMGTHFITAGYGGHVATTNDFVSLRVDATTGVRDLTYGAGGPRACAGGTMPGVTCTMDSDCGTGGVCPTAGVAMLSGFTFGDNARSGIVLPDDRIMLLGRLASARAPRTCVGGSMAGMACTMDSTCGTRACTGGTNDGTACTMDSACTGGGTCPAATFGCPETTYDAALWMLTPAGVGDTTFGGGDAVELHDLSGGALTNGGDQDEFQAAAVDPRGERVVVVGIIGGTNPAADSDGVIYMFDL